MLDLFFPPRPFDLELAKFGLFAIKPKQENTEKPKPYEQQKKDLVASVEALCNQAKDLRVKLMNLEKPTHSPLN